MFWVGEEVYYWECDKWVYCVWVVVVGEVGGGGGEVGGDVIVGLEGGEGGVGGVVVLEDGEEGRFVVDVGYVCVVEVV